MFRLLLSCRVESLRLRVRLIPYRWYPNFGFFPSLLDTECEFPRRSNPMLMILYYQQQLMQVVACSGCCDPINLGDSGSRSCRVIFQIHRDRLWMIDREDR